MCLQVHSERAQLLASKMGAMQAEVQTHVDAQRSASEQSVQENGTGKYCIAVLSRQIRCKVHTIANITI